MLIYPNVLLSPALPLRRRGRSGRRGGRDVFGRDVGLDRLSAVVADADDDDGLDGVARGVEVYGAGDAGKIFRRGERVAYGGAVERARARGCVGHDERGVVGRGGERVGRGAEV